jgi:L-alanine-DL-glutamate epimerase-like enolase superfamily enzyme
MKIDRRTLTKSLALAAGALALPAPSFLDFRNGKVWPNDRPGLGVSMDEKQLTLIETMTEGASGPTYLRPDGSPTHW